MYYTEYLVIKFFHKKTFIMVLVVNLSKSKIKELSMDKFTRKTSFEQWLSPLNFKLFDEQVENFQLNRYTKKLYMASFMKLLLYAQLHETESLRALSRRIF